MNNHELVAQAKNIEANYKTGYVNGCFGASMTPSHKERYINNGTDWNARNADTIRGYSEDTFGFDCVGLVKGILWGWSGDYNANYGGATYASNGVPDATIEHLMQGFTDVWNDAQGPTIEVGELVATRDWGHIGIFIGDGMCIEATPSWDNGVQTSRCDNVDCFDYPRTRNWDVHCKCRYIDYVAAQNEPEPQPEPEPKPEPQPTPEPTPSADYVDEIARQVCNGYWGNGEVRKQRLTEAGYDYRLVQNRVNEMYGAAPVEPSAEPAQDADIERVAREVINGDWGNGQERKDRLTAAGYDYRAVQDLVNELA